MARRSAPVRPVRQLNKTPPRITAPFAITWRQVFAVWVIGSLIVVFASWRVMPHQTVQAGHWVGRQSASAWGRSLYYGNRLWPRWIPRAVPRPRHWPGYRNPYARPKPSAGPMALPHAPSRPAGAGSSQPNQRTAPSLLDTDSNLHRNATTPRRSPAALRSRFWAQDQGGERSSAAERRRANFSSAPTNSRAARTFGGSSSSSTRRDSRRR